MEVTVAGVPGNGVTFTPFPAYDALGRVTSVTVGSGFERSAGLGPGTPLWR